MRPPVRTIVIFLLTIGLLAYFFRGVNLGEVWDRTRAADARLLVAGVFVTLMTYALRAFRWQYLLAPIGPTRFSTAVSRGLGSGSAPGAARTRTRQVEQRPLPPQIEAWGTPRSRLASSTEVPRTTLMNLPSG